MHKLEMYISLYTDRIQPLILLSPFKVHSSSVKSELTELNAGYN